MAEPYTRVNWDTTMYVNPESMNQMDKGIADNNEAIDILEKELQATGYGLSNVRGKLDSVADYNELVTWIKNNNVVRVVNEDGSDYVNLEARDVKASLNGASLKELGDRLQVIDSTYTRVNSPDGNIQLMNNVDVYAPDGASWRAVSASAFNTISSIKYKENVEDMTDEEAKKILELRPVTFDYKNDGEKGCLGFIAEEVEEVETYPVSYQNGEVNGLDYSKLVPQLVKMVQIQQKEIEALKKMID